MLLLAWEQFFHVYEALFTLKLLMFIWWRVRILFFIRTYFVHKKQNIHTFASDKRFGPQKGAPTLIWSPPRPALPDRRSPLCSESASLSPSTLHLNPYQPNAPLAPSRAGRQAVNRIRCPPSGLWSIAMSNNRHSTSETTQAVELAEEMAAMLLGLSIQWGRRRLVHCETCR